jgi:hypothetical protein
MKTSTGVPKQQVSEHDKLMNFFVDGKMPEDDEDY